ncbi:putative ATP-dependent RNA helicase kurz [Pseudolycoriella hygida]|uniref:RNA helicase n=1 Tax=Pseudolycoriella hygida TaxID=35572 RepID=A0A9Q0MQ38_9DIPT|nr:putative ATP-dependent RNA helicase kurz [Pseudolycoriella hygida]
MGKRKFNAKGRQVVDAIIDDTATKQIKLDIEEPTEYGGYDQSNALVLPSQKRKTKIKKDKDCNVTRILSKKQRKNLEKVVDKKKKKEGRASLLDKLASVQVASDELKQYTSIVNVQTKGLKNHLKEKIIKRIDKPEEDDGQRRWSSISGSQRKKRLALLNSYADDSDDGSKPKDYNIVGLDQSSSSDSESEETVETAVIASSKTKCSEEEVSPVAAPKEAVIQPTEPVEKVVTYKPTIYVHVERSKEIQAARLKLPILGEEQVIMETINENSIIILTGETGSGKTTQVPQFLYEAGYAEKKLIGITEPRRVAAISMSKRVATEMNLGTDVVSYLIRFEGNVTNKTKIKFMTDGVLLKELENDFTLTKYSVIILDEAHERSVYTDILVGLLSRIVLLREKRNDPLKLIIMSATLRVEDFTKNKKLFKNVPPVLSVETRQFPVTIHFNKHTFDNYEEEAYKKAVKIHRKLPEGGILIFLTGQHEVNNLVRKLRKAFPYHRTDETNTEKTKESSDAHYSDSEDGDEMDMKKAIQNSKKAKKKLRSMLSLPQISLDNYKLPTDDTDADLLDDSSIKDDDSDSDSEEEDNLSFVDLKSSQPMWVLPLYSLLPSDKQSRVFEKPPEGARLCVVSTNVAETSLTIPNIKYVIDSGRVKTRLYDKVTGVSSFVVTFTSKAGANQRAGRAGRTAPGYCYRLYSSAVYENEFDDITVPDIQKKPVDDLMLQMKCMGIDKVINFPFPSPPDLVQLQTAEYKLKLLGALEAVESSKSDKLTKVTPLGQAISAFPVAPRFGKMLALSHQQSLLPYTVCMVAALSVQEVLIEVSQEQTNEKKSKWLPTRIKWAGAGNSLLLGDPFVLLRAVGESEYAGSEGKLKEFCETNGLRPKAVAEIRKLRVQLTNEINLSLNDVGLCVDPKMVPPTDHQAKLLRQILLAGMGDQVAKKISDDEMKDSDDRQRFKYGYRSPEMEEPVFMHASSVLRKSKPEWVIYQEIFETDLKNGASKKMCMRGVTAIEPEWLLIYVRSMCNIRSVKEDPPPRYNESDGKVYCHVEATFGRSGWQLPLSEIEMPTSELCYRYFAMFLLNGDIFPQISEYKKKMRPAPKSIVKPWCKNTPNVVSFVNKLLSRGVASKQKLLGVWSKESDYLLNEFCDFLVDVNSSAVALNWPPTKSIAV